MKKSILFLAISILIITKMDAQWSDNTELNNMISSESNALSPKIATYSEDGTSYVQWFTLDGDSGCHPKIQKIDADGYQLWGENGIYISLNQNMTMLFTTAFCIGSDGCPIVFFPDERSGSYEGYIYKISPDGDFLWGTDGICITGGYEVYNTYLAANNDGSVWAVWVDGAEIYFRLVHADGTLGDIFSLNDGETTFPVIFTDDANNLIIGYFKYAGGYFMWPEREIYVKKFDAAGNTIWGPTLLMEAKSMNFVRKLYACSDGIGGGYINCTATPNDTHEIVVVHFDSEGNATTPTTGAYVANQNGMDYHYYPMMTCDPLTNNAIIIFRTSDAAYEATHSINAQALDAAGNRLWGDDCVTLIPSSTNYYLTAGIAAVPDGGAICLYTSGSAITHVQATRIDSNGEYVWENEHIIVSNAGSEKSFDEAEPMYFIDHQTIAIWFDDGRVNEPTGIYVQNINIDGTIGPYAGQICDPVTDLTAEIANNSITLLWNNPNTCNGYNIYRNGEFLTFVTATSFADNNPEDGDYVYCVEVVYEDCTSEQACIDVNYIGVNEYNNISIYPNPAGNHLEINTKSPCLVCIFNKNGVLMIEQKISKSHDIIDISKLKSGSYILMNGEEILKFIKN
ncbi:MAG: T9SS type A sorting domain-containing protein [Bacteroidales bacterium]|jgi:hypothetical protein|nr:T9SS type A sorting domain-containing protein [Bacteroidales bacterium]MDD2204619.1 T9SS type A sorting domain-containing protein [Bacteroidales bacterium]MDD3151278.1 T9SS type A sorting domain-containing protein [Bacteroidales bacterium]MDD3914240.1 T9SS type A sorting domain-containing protein [Bacteroidales bacterium]MDD4633444.1 T9SS type A sorting domain-containing protein [Bacteroidales bacterium]